VKVLMVTKVEDLESILGVCQGTRALLQDAMYYIIVRISELSTRISHTQKSAAIDSALTVDEHRLTFRILEKPLHGPFKLIVPM